MNRLFIDSNAGLCPGVKKAFNSALDFAQKRKNVFAYGEIVHNPVIVSRLEAAGIRTIHDLKALPPASSVIIRAHGILPAEEEYLISSGIEYLNLTCSIVKKIHNIIMQHRDNGYQIIIIGKPEHPETAVHLGHAGASAVVIGDLKAAAAVPVRSPCLAVAQTTISHAFFIDAVTELKIKTPELKVINTICAFVKERQEWIRQYAEKCTVSIVIGGKQSSNTARLYEIASGFSRAYWIENEDQFDPGMITDNDSVALTAGTSTMEETIHKVMEKMYTKEIFPVFIG